MKLISSDVMTAIIQSDFGIESDSFTHRYPDWIKDALGIIEIPKLREKFFKQFEVKDGVLKIPCEAGEIDSIFIKSSCGCGYEYLNIKNSDFPLACLKTRYNRNFEGEFTGPNRLKFNFKEGTIYIAWQSYLKDSKNYPMIPDNAKVKVAIGYYILHKLMLAGIKHPILSFKDAFELWENYYPQASNDVNWWTPQEYNKFVDMWLNINHNLNN